MTHKQPQWEVWMHLFDAPELEGGELFGGAELESLKTLVEAVQKNLLPRSRSEARAAKEAESAAAE